MYKDLQRTCTAIVLLTELFFGGVCVTAVAALATWHLLTTQTVPTSCIVKFDSKVYLNKVMDTTARIEFIGVESNVEVVTNSHKDSLRFHSRRLYIIQKFILLGKQITKARIQMRHFHGNFRINTFSRRDKIVTE